MYEINNNSYRKSIEGEIIMFYYKTCYTIVCDLYFYVFIK